jgi:hypothetical protein
VVIDAILNHTIDGFSPMAIYQAAGDSRPRSGNGFPALTQAEPNDRDASPDAARGEKDGHAPAPESTPSPGAVNLARNRPAVAAGYRPGSQSGAVDGNMSTGWNFRPVAGNSLYVDLGATYTVDTVVLDSSYGGDTVVMTGYNLEVSDDAVNWRQVFATTTENGGRDVIDNLNTKARYVRLNATAGSRPYSNEEYLYEFGVYAREATATTVNLEERPGVLKNPGKGWVLYGDIATGAPGTLLQYHNAGTKSVGSITYGRYGWYQLEPSEGVYKWNIIDNALADSAAAGTRFAFRVMAANSCSSVDYITPKWVFDAGAASQYARTACAFTRGAWQHVPVWNDPVFLRKLYRFVQAVANRYDAGGQLGWYEIGSYGNWGQGVVSDLGTATLALTKDQIRDLHLIPHKNAFKFTPLVAEQNYYAPLSLGIGKRNDVYYMTPPKGARIGSGSGVEGSSGTYGRLFTVGEWWGSYGWLRTHSKISEAGIRERIYADRLNYMGLGQWGKDGALFYAEHKALINQLANELGYHHVLQQATLPTTIRNNVPFIITTKWINKGVNLLYDKNAPAFALLDSRDAVVAKSLVPEINVKRWLAKYDDTNSVPVKEIASVRFSGVKPGTYRLAFGLLKFERDTTPTYRTANASLTANNWTVLSKVTVAK